jgi:hypothetical protein
VVRLRPQLRDRALAVVDVAEGDRACVGHTAWQAVVTSPSRIARSSFLAWMRAWLMRCTQ